MVPLVKQALPVDARPRNSAPISILVVDDSRLQRRLLTVALNRWGYNVLEAESGGAALAICKTHHIDMVLSDWMMPGMNGLEFCRLFRSLKREHYGYFILLTSNNEKDEVAQGLDVGADDFLTKPVNSPELHARIRAGERVLGMEAELVEKNQSITDTLQELQTLYQAVDHDLQEAKKLQMSLLPDPYYDLGSVRMSMLLQSSGHVGGDMIGIYFKSATRLGVYAIDVSGHGVSSALMTARLAGCLNANTPAHSIAMQATKDGLYNVKPPCEIAASINQRMLEELDTDLYLTMLLADIDLTTGVACMVQAGHPHPAIQPATGEAYFIGMGGLPVGLIAGAQFADFKHQLVPGDRLFIYSDGFTEASDAGGAFLDEAGWAALLTKYKTAKSPEVLSDLIWETLSFSANGEADDDLSIILVEFCGDAMAANQDTAARKADHPHLTTGPPPD